MGGGVGQMMSGGVNATNKMGTFSKTRVAHHVAKQQCDPVHKRRELVALVLLADDKSCPEATEETTS